MNYCEYDHNRDDDCGKPAQMKWHGMYLCPGHFDEAMALLEGGWLSREQEENDSLDEILKKDQ